LIDAVVTVVYRNIVIQRVASIRNYAANYAEDRKLLADRTSAEPITSIHGGPHVLIPFAIEDGGRLGVHALALLKAVATVALEKGRHPPFAYCAYAASTPPLASLWVIR